VFTPLRRTFPAFLHQPAHYRTSVKFGLIVCAVEAFTRQEHSMDIAFLLLTAVLSASTIALIFGVERLWKSK
jgi:hypothetical protein